MSHLYESCALDTQEHKLKYVEEHFPVVYDTVLKYKTYESRLNAIIAHLSEEDGGVAPTNVTAGIDAATPRIYTRKKKLKKDE